MPFTLFPTTLSLSYAPRPAKLSYFSACFPIHCKKNAMKAKKANSINTTSPYLLLKLQHTHVLHWPSNHFLLFKTPSFSLYNSLTAFAFSLYSPVAVAHRGRHITPCLLWNPKPIPTMEMAMPPTVAEAARLARLDHPLVTPTSLIAGADCDWRPSLRRKSWGASPPA